MSNPVFPKCNTRTLLFASVLCLIFFQPLWADGTRAEWMGVERIVVIGDVHGDYEQFRQLLQETGLIKRNGRWAGGKSHLVQVGDVPDRGPDSRKVLDLLMKLEKGAAKAGGAVHPLIGNHESMNIQGDLRYVHGGEYRAFVDSRSKRRQQQYYERTVEYLTNTLPPEEQPVFDDAYRKKWEKRYPLGFVEHRLAWAPSGAYGEWVLGNNAVIKIDNWLFAHGGVSPKYADRTLSEINEAIRKELQLGEGVPDDAIVNDELGPLWYRAFADGEESCETQRDLEIVLDHFDVDRMVIAHTPVAGTVLPRYGGRVILVDVGLAGYYGGSRAALVVEGGQVSVLQEGTRLSLPDSASEYLDEVAKVGKTPALLQKFLDGPLAQMLGKPLDCSVPEELPAASGNAS